MLPLRSLAPLVLAANFAACGGSLTARPGPRLEAEARRTVASLAASFERAQAEDFFAQIDQSEFPDFSSYQDRVRRFLLRNHQINLEVIVDAVVVNADEAAVNARWNRAFVDADGRPRKENGSCELFFKARPSGGLALRSIRGDSPF